MCKQLVFQVTAVDHRHNIVLQSDWHYYTKFTNLPIENYHGCGIWLHACLSTNIYEASIDDLYPYLIRKFERITGCKYNQPQLQQIEYFLLQNGGFQTLINGWDSDTKAMIKSHKFDEFYTWFIGMCYIIKDLKSIYDRIDDPLIALFYSKTTIEQILPHKPDGTFILRLSTKQNGLNITYKNPSRKVANIPLTRVDNQKYRAGKCDKEADLFQLIRPWTKLKCLYTPNKLIRKNVLF